MTHYVIKRLDPSGCGCTDCLTGFSRPADAISEDDTPAIMARLVSGDIQNATGADLTARVVFSLGYGADGSIMSVDRTVTDDSQVSAIACVVQRVTL